MSFITSGVKIFEEPKIYFFYSAGALVASPAIPVLVREEASPRAASTPERLTATELRAGIVLDFFAIVFLISS